MEFFETVQKRHSYRGAFWDKPIPDADIRRILQAGISAPSGYNAQTTRFAVVTEPELLQEVCDWLYAARLNRPMPGSGGLHDSGVMYTLRARSSDSSATAAIQILEDGRAVVNGVRYRLRQKDMAALNAIYQHLNTIYD